MAKTNNTNKVKVATRQLDEEILELRKAGLSYHKIAKKVDRSPATCYQSVIRSLDRLNKEIVENADQMRRMEVERLDKMYDALEEKVSAGDVAAITAALRIQERRAKLFGLDAPTKQTIQVEDLSKFTDAVIEAAREYIPEEKNKLLFLRRLEVVALGKNGDDVS